MAELLKTGRPTKTLLIVFQSSVGIIANAAKNSRKRPATHGGIEEPISVCFLRGALGSSIIGTRGKLLPLLKYSRSEVLFFPYHHLSHPSSCHAVVSAPYTISA